MVSIIILSYNTSSLLVSCLTSVYRYLPKNSFEVIVVDNASADESVSILKKNFPQVRLIENSENVGFAKGCNIGAKEAKGEYLLFLNSDTELVSNSLFPMIEVLEEKKQIAVVGGNLKNTDGSYQVSFNSFYSIPTIFRTLFLKEEKWKTISASDAGREVDWVAGTYLLIRKSVFDKIHGFDSTYFMYIEDMDLCFRVREIGYGVYFLPASVVMHKGQGSSNRSFAIIHIYKGMLHYYEVHKSFFQYCVVKFLLYIKAYSAIGIGTVTGNSYLTTTYRNALAF